MKMFTFLLFFVLQLSGCGPMWKDGEYEVYNIDGSISLGIKLDDSGMYHGRVGHEVVAVGSNKSYVVVKQFDQDSKTISYFYIVKANDKKYLNPDEITQGPFTEKQFSNLSRRLKLPNFSWGS